MRTSTKVICTTGILVLGLAVPAGAGECTPTDATALAASTTCDGVVGITTEQDEATVTVSTSVQADATLGPSEVGANLAVHEEESHSTPSYTSPRREVVVPGTSTPELTVPLPRVDIREPIDLQAGGSTTVPSITLDERSVRFGGSHLGVPDHDVELHLFEPPGAGGVDPPVDRPKRRDGQVVEGQHPTTGGITRGITSAVVPARASAGPDGHVATAGVAADPSPIRPTILDASRVSADHGQERARPIRSWLGQWDDRPWGSSLSGLRTGYEDSTTGLAGDGFAAWWALVVALALTGAVTLRAHRRTPEGDS